MFGFVITAQKNNNKMVKKKQKVMAKISDDGRQKRITVPKQKETKDWEQNDLIELKKVGEDERN